MDKRNSFLKSDPYLPSEDAIAQNALDNVSLTIPAGSFTAIIGHTGSGKSTLVQHINALLKPTSGSIDIFGRTITPNTTNKNLKELRQHVGMVFQFPEKQLFEESVIKDIVLARKIMVPPKLRRKVLPVEAMRLVGWMNH